MLITSINHRRDLKWPEITIELNTDESLQDVLVLQAVAGAYGRGTDEAPQADQAQNTYNQINQGPTPAAPPATRTRRTKAQIEADNAASGSQSATAPPSSEPQAASPTAQAAEPSSEVTLEALNAKMRDLLNNNVAGGALKITEALKTATGGKYTSPNAAAVANEQHFFPVMMEALNAL